MMKKLLTLLLTMVLLPTIVMAQNNPPSNTLTLTQTICNAWDQAVSPNETVIIGAVVVLGLFVVGYEAFIITHLRRLQASGSSEQSPDDLSKLMASSMTVIIGTLVVVGAIIGAFGVVSVMICP